MATFNVIDCPAFSNSHAFLSGPNPGNKSYPVGNAYPSSNSYRAPRANAQRWFVREEEGDYGKLLNMPQWPPFPDGAYLKPVEAGRFYRGIQGMQGLVHLLNRSQYLRGLHNDYHGEPDQPLSEAQESKLWSALIELAADLTRLADDVHRASETLRQ